MNPENNERDEEQWAAFFAALNNEPPPPDRLFLERLRERTTDVFAANEVVPLRRPRLIAQLCGADLPLVQADAGRLEQVLSNLINNALKFTPERGTIGLDVTAVDTAVEVAVADSGPGIPPEEMSLLFQKFSQTSTGKSAAAPGTGLGLLICRHLVEAHGGRIWAESEVGRGSRFIFRLPAEGAQ